MDITINAEMTDNNDDDGDWIAERGVDLVLDRLPEGMTPRLIMAILFDGFLERLEAAGIRVKEITNFT